MQVILGFLFGVVISLVCLFLAIVLGWNLGAKRGWVFPLLNAIGLIVAGFVALRRMRESSYALGIVIALALAFILNTVCGAFYMH